MLFLVNYTDRAKSEDKVGYFDTGNLNYKDGIFNGFIEYMKDKNYYVKEIYNPYRKLNNEELIKLTSLQFEFANAIQSTKYYPDSEFNNYIRITYANSRLANHKFRDPKTNTEKIHTYSWWGNLNHDT